jgi:pyruvate/2-oxoglutarate/acetoin dehydrogenase E1 component/TPP-dependent pyruvate/acetoin dehydrogenase alpha subunit
MNIMPTTKTGAEKRKFSKEDKERILNEYKLAVMSRNISLLGRKEVLTGKAKFGIFGDGKELPQIVMARHFQNGDFRSGYYRDQTFMLAVDGLTIEQFFAQLYAHADIEADPHSGGRQMNAHFATRLLDEQGRWKPQTEMKNSSADLSPTAAQMPRLLGLAQASKVYRHHPELAEGTPFSRNGNEIAWGTIGDASTSEGIFWETVNAAGVLKVPMVISVWDDGFGISVSKKFQTTKESISTVLRGFQRTKRQPGLEILTAKAWDYDALNDVYAKAEKLAREEHIPVLIHVEEVTQPQGHSTSGSHERYKSEERLAWEVEYCCNRKFRVWIEEQGIAKAASLDEIEEAAEKEVREAQKRAWKAFQTPLKELQSETLAWLEKLASELPSDQAHQQAMVAKLADLKKQLQRKASVLRRDSIAVARQAKAVLSGVDYSVKQEFLTWLDSEMMKASSLYDSHQISESESSPLRIDERAPIYPEKPEQAEQVDGRVVLRDNFQALFERYPEALIFGEDSGRLGDVNLGLEGMQEQFGELRVSDTGIREATILGQGIGMALRGLRPIAEIQYLDYLLYCFQTLSDDLATIHYRTRGGQAAPVIVRTRGHRLEGIWHAGSPMGMIVSAVHGMHVCVPRNLTEAAGMYNTLMQGDDPALIVEPLNAYRLKEPLPLNPGDYTVPLGIPVILQEGTDITVVSYGSTLNLIRSVLPRFDEVGISVELIDVRTLLPFDREHRIGASLRKTNRIIFIDEDMPGGATAMMMQHVLQEQGGYFQLDSPAKCVTAKPHRPAYASDGDYFSKPNTEDIFEAVYGLMSEADRARWRPLY